MTFTTATDEQLLSRCSFARLVALHCRLSGHDPEQRDLEQWLASVWPLVTEDMDPAQWARAYLLAYGLTVPADVSAAVEAMM